MKVSEGDAKVPHSVLTNFVAIKVFPVNMVLMLNEFQSLCLTFRRVTILLQSRAPGCFLSV